MSGSPIVGQLSHPLPLYSQLGNLIVKVGNQMNDKKTEKKLKEVFVQAFDNFLNNLSCTLPLTFFQLPLNGNWNGILSIVPKLIDGAFSSEVRAYRRINSVTLMSTLFHN